MIEICLNPDNQMLGGEVFESVDSDVHADSKDSQEMALKTAEKLLKELRPKPGQQMLSYQILEGMLQLATKLKPNIEKALQDFMNMAAQVCSTFSLNKKNRVLLLPSLPVIPFLSHDGKKWRSFEIIPPFS